MRRVVSDNAGLAVLRQSIAHLVPDVDRPDGGSTGLCPCGVGGANHALMA